MSASDALIARGRRVLATESQAVAALEHRLGEDFAEACRLLLACEGRIVVTGMGKSGHVGSKIAATLASTGSPSFFLHPGEAVHGDIGMIIDKDVVLALSNSGETDELLTILPVIKRLDVPLIALTGNRASTLARYATVTLDVSVTAEACPLNLAPTASTTATLAMGDALAVAVLEARGFTEDDFARSHPGGTLGRRLLLHVDEVMRSGDELPAVGGERQGPDRGAVASPDDRRTLAEAQGNGDVLGTYRCLAGASETDVRPLLAQVRLEMGLEPDPIAALKAGGYEARAAVERA